MGLTGAWWARTGFSGPQPKRFGGPERADTSLCGRWASRYLSMLRWWATGMLL